MSSVAVPAAPTMEKEYNLGDFCINTISFIPFAFIPFFRKGGREKDVGEVPNV